jgi:hypothetical protein
MMGNLKPGFPPSNFMVKKNKVSGEDFPNKTNPSIPSPSSRSQDVLDWSLLLKSHSEAAQVLSEAGITGCFFG